MGLSFSKLSFKVVSAYLIYKASFTYRKVILCMQGDSCRQNILKTVNRCKLHYVRISRLHHHIRLNQQACLDIEWWLTFLPSWNGTSYILETEWFTSTSMLLYTDAASSVGWGAVGVAGGYKPTGQHQKKN